MLILIKHKQYDTVQDGTSTQDSRPAFGEEVKPHDIPETQRADSGQFSLFEIEEDWRKTWVGMPEFEQKDLESWQSIKVHFKTMEDRKKFSELIEHPITDITASLWYPKAKKMISSDKGFITESPVNPRHPVYVISKGRWDSRLTVKSLEQIGIPYHIVIEPQEYDQYAAVIDPKNIIVLPFSNLGLGSIPARNFVWQHAIDSGAEWHWIMDDNIAGFWRLYNNLKTRVRTGAIFKAAEDFVDRYENVVQAGFNYYMFAPQKSDAIKPFTLNTRIYSCILIKNDIPLAKICGERWRGKYNEDTDLSLRILKAGYCTILFNAFLAWKMTTGEVKGGNMTELYGGDEETRSKSEAWQRKRLEMAQSLVDQHPDITTITEKWGRPQHSVYYGGFKKNKLILKPGVKLQQGVNNYGMKLVAGDFSRNAK